MRLDINLATQPYEDSRQFWLRWGTALVATATLTLGLLAFTAMNWFTARRDHATIATYRSQIAQRIGLVNKRNSFSTAQKIAPRETNANF